MSLRGTLLAFNPQTSENFVLVNVTGSGTLISTGDLVERQTNYNIRIILDGQDISYPSDYAKAEFVFLNLRFESSLIIYMQDSGQAMDQYAIYSLD